MRTPVERRLSDIVSAWGPLLIILLLGLVLRLAYWPDFGQGDLWIHGIYVGAIKQFGVLNFYRHFEDIRLYPPFMVVVFDLIGTLYLHTRILQVPFASPLW